VHRIPTWWALKKTVTYANAAIFDVNSSIGALALVVPCNIEGTDISIIHNGDGTFMFPHVRGVDRVAVMSADLSTFYIEYQFAKISGGPTLKRTVNVLPTPEPEAELIVVAPEPTPEPEGPTYAERVQAATYSVAVTVNNGDYELDGVANEALVGSVGESFYFDLTDASLSDHPLRIYNDTAKTLQISVGVESDADGLLFQPPIAGTFSYQCLNHENMGGTITVS
jgi:plastocyanin